MEPLLFYEEANLNPPIPNTPAPETPAPEKISIFISHSGTDAKLAKALIDLIQAAVVVPDSAIRCTSVDGYKLDGGDDAPGVLRSNLRDCSVVLGQLTKASLNSSYVLMELGAAWAFEKTAIPLLGPGVAFQDLPGPFRDIHALKMDSDSDMAGLIDTLVKRTGLSRTNNSPKFQVALRFLRDLLPEVGTRLPLPTP